MPRQVDSAERRALIARAVWRVILRDGLESASVRKVAAEAGLSAGSLRHYFASQSELVAFSMELVIERVTARATARLDEGFAAVLDEVLPLDEERRAEVEVWLAFTARSRVDPALDAVRRRSDEALRGLCAAAVAEVTDGRLADSEASIEAEALYALVDGLALHAVAGDGADPSPAAMRAVLARHLERLGA
ncbi:MAG: TetR/AcrR family transcriptional regulator [Thermoleophilia bacterium]